jgi:hypothetical protein
LQQITDCCRGFWPPTAAFGAIGQGWTSVML